MNEEGKYNINEELIERAWWFLSEYLDYYVKISPDIDTLIDYIKIGFNHKIIKNIRNLKYTYKMSEKQVKTFKRSFPDYDEIIKIYYNVTPVGQPQLIINYLRRHVEGYDENVYDIITFTDWEKFEVFKPLEKIEI